MQTSTRTEQVRADRPKFVPPPVRADRVTGASGSPLAADVRAPIESRFGRDLSGVRVHTDQHAADAARELHARAYTVGEDIVFGAGQFAPDSDHGNDLLVHELTHVLQPAGQGLSEPGDGAEQEADRATAAFDRGDLVQVKTPAAGAVQRQPDPQATTGTGGDALIESASPFLAAAIGSDALDHFDTGLAVLTSAHKARLAVLAHTITVLLRTYPLSSLDVVGHTDTVGAEADNVGLGQGRADAVAAELSALGVPASIVSTTSRGEGAPSVRTKDNVPNAQNRKVDVRFRPRAYHLGLGVPPLKQPTPTLDPTTRPDRPPDLRVKPKIVPDDPSKASPDLWKPIPPPIKGTGPKSPLDVIAEKVIDPVVDSVAGGLSKDMRDRIKSGARSAVKSGVTKIARAAAEAAGVTDPKGLEAIEKATEAAIGEKGGARP